MNREAARRWSYAASACMLVTCLVLGACARRAARFGSAESGGWYTRSGHQTLANYKGKVVLLNLYSFECTPCLSETPLLTDLQKEFGPQGLQVVGVDVYGIAEEQYLQLYIDRFQIQYPVGLADPDFPLQYMGADRTLPFCVVFDRNGRVLRNFIGYTPSTKQELEEFLQTTLKAASPVSSPGSGGDG